MGNVPAFPDVVGGALIPHMSAKRRTRMFDEAFEKLGGLDKLVEWAGKSDENYGEFLKQYARGQARQADPGAGADTLATAIKKLDEIERMERAQVIDATARDVSDAPQ
jgi:hypothetical protein